MESSFRLLRVRGIDIGATWSWLLVFGFIIFSLSTQLFPSAYAGLSTSTYWVMGVVSGVLFVISLLLHELGHAFRAQKEGMQIEGITLWLFGGVARFKGMFPTAGAEFRIAIAGPLVTVVLAIVFGALWLGLSAVGAPRPVVGVPNYLWQINVLLLVFNMIPALPLDGGRVLRSLFWQTKGNFTAATVSAARVGRVLAGGLIALGVLGFVSGTGQGLWLAVVGWFVLQAGQAELSYALFRQTLSGLRVRDLMTPGPHTVDPEMSIASFIEEVAHMRGHSTYPVEEFGRLVGMISLRQAAQVPHEDRSGTRVREIMVARDSLPVLSPDAEITEAAPALQGVPGRAVVEEFGQVLGILSMSDIARAIEVEQIRHPTPPGRRRRRPLVIALLIVGLLVLAAWWYAPPYVTFAPGAAFDVTGDITIKGTDTTKVDGKYVLTSVAVQQPNVFGLVAALAQGRQTAPLSAVVPQEVDPDEYFEQQEDLFEETQKIATAAAAEAAGFEVSLRGTGAEVGALIEGSPASDVLKEGDVIVGIESDRVRLADDVARRIRSRPSGTTFELEIEREKRKRSVEVRSRSGVLEGSRAPGIGVFLQTRDFDVDLPFDVNFRKREIGGPSAGLTYALAVYDLLEEKDIANGRSVATTGTIDLEGRVGQVGGIEDKAVAAKRAKADLFLVPEEEVELARDSGLSVLGVGTLDEAIEALG